ncbi:discoidin domain-containing protein [Amycolatopsis sp., V23-08]|uniref:Discoidin domain-containing protein n=1 Tax=Amycolatopsis heterodermiae TaxID=3110235 RepID=A0ABU5RG12_9PSEU|nr:discoidin domain-containing protein [Amycolatopsis sp., V23-08]MEA5365207.1 discoidin domain-containing protein [Amycolatopsis sp., V23-08]
MAAAPPPPPGKAGASTGAAPAGVPVAVIVSPEKAELIAALAQPVVGRALAADQEPPELQPQPVQIKTRAIVRSKPTRRLELGDLVCGACGEGNVPSRHFCSRCGESLERASVVRPVWWRRLLAKLKRRPKAYRIGTRPGQKGTGGHRKWLTYSAFRKVRVVFGIALLVLGLGYAFYPPMRNTVLDNISALYRKVTPQLEPVHPVTVTSTTMIPGHPPGAAADTYTDTYWATPWDSRKHPRITFTFGETRLLRSIILYSGAHDAFVANARPSILKVTLSNGVTENLLPQDVAGQQTLPLKNTTLVNSATIEVAEIFDGQSSPDVAMSEIEFFALQ